MVRHGRGGVECSQTPFIPRSYQMPPRFRLSSPTIRLVARILIVEPDPELSELLSRVVARAGHEPRVYVGAASRAPGQVDALVLEPQAPGAVALAARLREEQPALPIVEVSLGAPSAEALALEPAAVLEKPFTLGQLEEALESALLRAAPTSSA